MFNVAGDVKRICDTELGLQSSCCLDSHISTPNLTYLANFSLKINVKMGGRNTVLVDALSQRIPFVTDIPTIIFGADVTHPHPGEDSSPSIAAVSFVQSGLLLPADIYVDYTVIWLFMVSMVFFY